MGSGASSRATSRASIVSTPYSAASSRPRRDSAPKRDPEPARAPERATKLSDKEEKNQAEEKEKEELRKGQARKGSEAVVPPPGGAEVMISYSHNDTDFMKKFKAGLEEAGITVWVDITGLSAGVNFLSKIGQAIIDCKMFIQLLSESSISSKYCQDELALAYVSNKPIFPVGIQLPDQLFPKMDTGVKLQLARFTWNLFDNPDNFDQDMAAFVSKLEGFKESGRVESTLERGKTVTRENSRQNVNRYLKKQTSFNKKLESMSDVVQDIDEDDFWSTNFKKMTEVPWDKFVKTFSTSYKKALQVIFSSSDQEWLQRIVQRELCSEDNMDIVTHDGYLDFCTVDGEQLSFWQRVQDQAVESYTMKEVFDMNSSVRVEAIENLGKFRSKAVVEALVDLLNDKDNNIRAVAAISLARTGEDSKRVVKQLIRCLSDSDRLVREGACLALGHLKADDAVPKILHLWRNDFISSVREAAQVALEQIGGNEANKAMYITKVLSEEIRTLTQE